MAWGAAPTGAKLGDRPRVLVVDDDDDVATLVREVLHDAGYAVATAIHGAAALEVLVTHEPALILVDLRMPIMDGWSFIEQYRRRGGHARIVALTGASDVARQERNPGVDAVLPKPFGIDALLETVASIMDRPSAAQTSLRAAGGAA